MQVSIGFELHMPDFAVTKSSEKFPDFINAPPKLIITVRQVEKWLDSKVFLRQEEGFREESAILG